MYFGKILATLLALTSVTQTINAQEQTALEKVVKAVTNNPATERKREPKYQNAKVNRFTVSIGLAQYRSFEIVHGTNWLVCFLHATGDGKRATYYIEGCSGPLSGIIRDKKPQQATVAETEAYQLYLHQLLPFLTATTRLARPVNVKVTEQANAELVTQIRDLFTQSKALMPDDNGVSGIVAGPFEFYISLSKIKKDELCTFVQKSSSTTTVMDLNCDGTVDAYGENKAITVDSPTAAHTEGYYTVLHATKVMLAATVEAFPNR